MLTATVNVSFPRQLLQVMDKVAKEEACSRSELLREAVRAYVERKKRWQEIFAFSRRQAKKLRLKPEDVDSWIQEYRRTKASRG